MAVRVFGLPDPVALAVVAMVSVTAGFGVVSAQSPAAAPAMASSTGAPPAVEESGCFRPLSDVIWGFLVTLLACSVAYWGRRKHRKSGTREKFRDALLAVFIPIHDLHKYIYASFENAMLIWKYQQTVVKAAASPMPSKQASPNPRALVKVESEAMVIGEVAVGKTKDGDYERKELSPVGILALMLAEGLPEYDELKFLRGNSGFAMIAIAIQALGYITAVLFREVKDLPVAPLEVIGLILNIMLLIEVSVYSFFNPCHRPLVIYTNSKREEKLLETLGAIKKPNIPWDRTDKVSSLVLCVVDLCFCGIVVYFIVTLTQVSNIFVVLPLIFFVVATIILITDSVRRHFFGFNATWKCMVDWFTISLYMIVYTWALVATIVYWKHQHFNARAELFNVSQLIPFIG